MKLRILNKFTPESLKRLMAVMRSEATPWWVKLLMWTLIVYIISPIDLIPGDWLVVTPPPAFFLGLIALIDDAVALLLLYLLYKYGEGESGMRRWE